MKGSCLQHQKPPKATMIPLTDAGTNKLAVMIKCRDATVAFLAMVGS
jgi:hypothetical protein